MQCSNYFKATGQREFPCGRCKSCRINHRRQVTARILLEWRFGVPHGSWVTLSYREDDLPEGGQLVPGHLRAFLRSLGKAEVWPRYFGVGEYGDRTGRPHYHVLLFGRRPGLVAKRDRIYDPVIEDAWKKGGTYTEDFGESASPSARAAYLASYSAKKWTKDTPDGRVPEFSRRSQGIGLAALPFLVDACRQLPAVPRTFRMDGKIWPLDRYIRSKIQEETGLDHAKPESTEPLTVEQAARLDRRLRSRDRLSKAHRPF